MNLPPQSTLTAPSIWDQDVCVCVCVRLRVGVCTHVSGDGETHKT